MAKRKPYKPKSLTGAAQYVRCLRKQIDDYERYSKAMRNDIIALAKLVATGPAFTNPLEAMAAQEIRNQWLRGMCRMNPDGTPIVD